MTNSTMNVTLSMPAHNPYGPAFNADATAGMVVGMLLGKYNGHIDVSDFVIESVNLSNKPSPSPKMIMVDVVFSGPTHLLNLFERAINRRNGQ